MAMVYSSQDSTKTRVMYSMELRIDGSIEEYFVYIVRITSLQLYMNTNIVPGYCYSVLIEYLRCERKLTNAQMWEFSKNVRELLFACISYLGLIADKLESGIQYFRFSRWLNFWKIIFITTVSCLHELRID